MAGMAVAVGLVEESEARDLRTHPSVADIMRSSPDDDYKVTYPIEHGCCLKENQSVHVISQCVNAIF